MSLYDGNMLKIIPNKLGDRGYFFFGGTMDGSNKKT